jgi:hypothetical protein
VTERQRDEGTGKTESGKATAEQLDIYRKVIVPPITDPLTGAKEAERDGESLRLRDGETE